MPEFENTQESLRTIKIQEAQPDDAPGIAEVQRLTWLDTYPNDEHGITRNDIKEKVDHRHSEESVGRMRTSITQPEDCTLRLVAKDGDMVVGHCFVIKEEPYNKLQVLYVLPEYQGLGVGGQLAKQAMDWLGAERDIALEVVSYNTDAIEFYKKLGFEITGDAHNAVAKLPSGKVMPEVKMIKREPPAD